MFGHSRYLMRAVVAIGAWTGVTLPAGQAQAHIDLDQAGTHLSRHGGALFDIKTAPCGVAGTTRGTNIYTYKPGATITISIAEYIPHPGYFRIAFDDDGHNDFVDPASVTGESGDCAGDPKCGPGMEDYCNNDTVLLDNLDRHSSTEGPYTWTVTLPNVECTNCTLQIIQVMEDLDLHTRLPYPGDDLYYQCIDLVLANDAEDTGVSPAVNDAIDCTADAPVGGEGGAGGAGGAGGEGGAGGTGGAGGAGGVGGTGGAGGAGASGTGGTGGDGGTGGTGGNGAGTGGTGGDGGSIGGAAGMTAAGTGAPSSSSDGSSGCAASGALTTKNALGTLLPLALALLFRRRRTE